ncbi:TPA: ATP-binding protein [Streptococcus suis]|nr:sensor histidine kinase [Streptococcus suis]HEM2666739.1 ATP-binding protein [Streptococcus suis]HEM2672263.1 ATP-binding protein [Streptococcus suis]HEM2714755.1 ATP-binding protein [Streptococcus suis]HEM2746550.1 ATP-binding protein [Streptococcus suis]
MTETLKYVVEDRVLAEVLGRNNFSTKESAVLELVKNAYDAGAEKLSISFNKSESNGKLFIEIADDGTGMNADDIKNAWMHVGKSTREYVDSKTGRVFAGSKGIGRFALARLGEKIELFSKKDGNFSIKWSTDWEKSSLESIELSDAKSGTIIRIYDLRDKWSSRNIIPLKVYLSKVYNDDKMEVILNYQAGGVDVTDRTKNIWINPKIGENFVDSIKIDYDSNSQTLNVKLVLDEFKSSVKEIVGLSPKGTEVSLNIASELKKDIIKLLKEDEEEKEVSEEDIEAILTELGDFSGMLYFSLVSVTDKDFEKFEYKYQNLSDRYSYGVILYRNSFSIDSFEGRRDWLKLSQRAAASPAAASHVSGSWRVRHNQLSGYISIDKQKNNHIEDISNRQGVVENIYFNILVEIIHVALKEFESYRQNIIRQISRYKDRLIERTIIEAQKESTAEDIVRSTIENPEKISELTKDDFEKIQEKINTQKQALDDLGEDRKRIEENYRYEVQLLNVLATLQLKVSSLSHEVQNNRNSLAANPTKIEEALKRKYGWGELLLEKPSSRNIPKLIDGLSNDLEKVLDLADTIIDETKKDNFAVKEFELEELLDLIVNKWKQQYNWVKFIVRVNHDEKIKISYDLLMVIMDNLILNSVQINESTGDLSITIELNYSDGELRLVYFDNGVGLDAKYKDNPGKILNVHETTREDGHGLGMWIVSNTIYKLGGEIEINPKFKGFYLQASIKIDESENQ